jgi:hypothetical protein
MPQLAAASINEDPGQVTTTMALHLRRDLAFDAWVRMGRQISGIASASAWWLGDWLIYGERTYGQRYRTAFEVTCLDYQTLRNYAWVARRFSVSRRRDTLSFQHHAEVAALPDPEQDLWLERAQRSRWSRNELRRQLSAARRSREPMPTARLVRHCVEVTAGQEERWRRAADLADRPLHDWIVAAIDAAADAELGERLPRLADARRRRPRGRLGGAAVGIMPGTDTAGTGELNRVAP